MRHPTPTPCARICIPCGRRWTGRANSPSSTRCAESATASRSPMRFSRSLRFRVATAFAAIGGVISLLMAIGLYFGVQDAGERLIDETLNAEMQDYLSRRSRNPHSLPPATATLLGYVLPTRPGEPAPPDGISLLPPGQH